MGPQITPVDEDEKKGSCFSLGDWWDLEHLAGRETRGGGCLLGAGIGAVWISETFQQLD